MIDRRHIGMRLPTAQLQVEPGRLEFFAKAIGETDRMYFDDEAARAAGYSARPAPPTFLFSAGLDSGVMEKALVELGVDLSRILHAEQSFSYHAPVLAGDTISVEGRISDIYDKRGGALEFIVMDSSASNQHGGMVAEMNSVLVLRS